MQGAPPASFRPPGQAAGLRAAEALLAQRNPLAAETEVRAVLAATPEQADAWMLLARALQQRADFPGMHAAALRALALRPEQWQALMLLAEAAMLAGETERARSLLDHAEARAGEMAAAWERLAALNTQMFRHADAARCAARLAQLSPAKGAFALASNAIALGKLDEAETLLDSIIERTPAEADAWYNRATIRRQTAERNHIDALRSALARLPAGAPAAVPLGFALAKELEDVGEHADSFVALQRAAQIRRMGMAYDCARDVATIDTLIEAFDRDWLGRQLGLAATGPVFVIGLPRTGTTLVDRILSAHSQVASLDEANDFTNALLCEVQGVTRRGNLAQSARAADMTKLGERYWRALRGYGETAPYLVNKTPANFLYAGLIAAALPQARIIHLRRDPMDAGYAIYKTLFRMAYPFSYDLGELGRYMWSYARLMRHWREVLPPGIMLEVDYEALVRNQEAESRRLVGFLGLEWESACFDFHLNPSATATASAAQVREPMHDRSIGLWRQHERGLAPLAEAFHA